MTIGLRTTSDRSAYADIPSVGCCLNDRWLLMVRASSLSLFHLLLSLPPSIIPPFHSPSFPLFSSAFSFSFHLSFLSFLAYKRALQIHCICTLQKRCFFNPAKAISVAAEWHPLTPTLTFYTPHTLETKCVCGMCWKSPKKVNIVTGCWHVVGKQRMASVHCMLHCAQTTNVLCVINFVSQSQTLLARCLPALWKTKRTTGQP